MITKAEGATTPKTNLTRAALSEIQRTIVKFFDTSTSQITCALPVAAAREVRRLDYLASILPLFSQEAD